MDRSLIIFDVAKIACRNWFSGSKIEAKEFRITL
jgi:hypothetical protein